MTRSWKTVRVFISSTFRDMHAERDHLVRQVFPELRERCQGIHLHMIDVDLRWGVSEKDAEDGKALDICLDEIDNCRPYFVGLLGHRYGWVPPGSDQSITAQEISHGVLHTRIPRQVVDLRMILEGRLEGRSLTQEQREILAACFAYDPNRAKYILKPDISDHESEVIRSVFAGYSNYQRNRSFFFFRKESLTRVLAAGNDNDFFEHDEERKTKLHEMKRQVVDAGLPYWEYDDIETLGDMVLETLWQRFASEASRIEPIERGWLEEESELHEQFMVNRRRRFVGRRDTLSQIRNTLESDAIPRFVVVSGGPGCGKSALLAQVALEMIERHADWLVIPHFVGASASSTSLHKTLQRFCETIYNGCEFERLKREELSKVIVGSPNAEIERSRVEKEYSIPSGLQELFVVFPQFLQKASSVRPLLIVMDAVNQMENTGEPPEDAVVAKRAPSCSPNGDQHTAGAGPRIVDKQTAGTTGNRGTRDDTGGNRGIGLSIPEGDPTGISEQGSRKRVLDKGEWGKSALYHRGP